MQDNLLQECENYVKKVIFLHGGSTLIDQIILLITPIYLEKELNASSSMIGITLALIGIVYAITMTIIPYLAESKSKYFEWISYDKLIVIRLFLSIIIIFLIGLIKSIPGFIILSTLNAMFNIGFETSQSSISLLLPQQKADTFIYYLLIVHAVDFIISAIILSLTIDFVDYSIIFYSCSVVYGLLFIFSLKHILHKESKLLSKQMEFFDEKYYVEYKIRISRDISNKYRRRSSVARSIFKFLESKNENIEETEQIEAIMPETNPSINLELDGVKIDVLSKPSIGSKASFNSRSLIDFPIYDKRATKIVMNKMNEDIHSDKQDLNKTKSTLILSKIDRIIICLVIILESIKAAGVEIVTKWCVLYVVTRFDESIALSNLFVAVGGIAAVFGVALFPFFKDIAKTILFNENQSLNKKEDIINISFIVIILNTIVAIVFFLWIDALPYYHFGWFVMFIAGFIVAGVTAVPPNVILIRLNTEHLEAKLISIKNCITYLGSSTCSLCLGFLWKISVNSWLYSLITMCLMASFVGMIIFIVAHKIVIDTKKENIDEHTCRSKLERDLNDNEWHSDNE